MGNCLWKVIKYLMMLCLVSVLYGCSPAKEQINPGLIWTVAVSKSEVKESLDTVEGVTQYNGSKIDVEHKQSPASGNVYLILNVTVSKTGNQSTPFDWQWLVVEDASGNSYHRLANDTFLEQFQYTPRITGLELRMGENSGWMCYEIPSSAAAGKLNLAYTAQGSQQEIALQK